MKAKIFQSMKIAISVGFYFLAPLTSANDNFEKPFGYGEMYVSLEVGYGAGFKLGNSGTGDTNDAEILATFPSFGIGISDPMGVGSWYGGNFDFLVEGEFLTFLGPAGGYSLGLVALVRYNFLEADRFVPFLELGVGAGYINTSLQDQADGQIFYPQGGAGFHYFFNHNLAMNLSYRYLHMSNKSTKSPNNGINTHMGLLGVSYHFD